MKESLVKLRQYLLSGVSFAIPFIACGGIMIAMAIAFAPMRENTLAKNADGTTKLEDKTNLPIIAPGGPDFDDSPTLKLILDIGVASFTLMPVVLAGYIANAMAGKPGLVPGMVGGWLATHLGVSVVSTTRDAVQILIDGKMISAVRVAEMKEASAGFLGAMLAGLLAGYVVNWLKKIPVHKYIKPIMPILIIPILSSTVIGIVMLKVIGVPISHAMSQMGNGLENMSHGGSVLLLAALLGTMIAFDMGGPINKTAFFFGAGLVSEGHYTIMGCVAAAICVPPLGMGLATMIHRKIWTEEQRESGIASLAMGMIGITEGAIPFAASDPVRVIPCICFGSAVASVIAMAGHVGDHAPHGGPIVLPVVDNRIMYVVAIVVGTLCTAIAINLVKTITNRKTTADATLASGQNVAVA